MDPGAKLLIFIGGIGAIVGLIAFVVHKVRLGPPPPSEHQQKEPHPYTED